MRSMYSVRNQIQTDLQFNSSARPSFGRQFLLHYSLVQMFRTSAFRTSSLFILSNRVGLDFSERPFQLLQVWICYFLQEPRSRCRPSESGQPWFRITLTLSPYAFISQCSIYRAPLYILHVPFKTSDPK